MKIYTLVGLPGSGKSTYAKRFPECKVVSTDSIRKEILGSEENQDNGKLIFDVAFATIAKHLTAGYDIIFDATNLTKRARKRVLRFNAEHIAVYFNTSVEECKERNSNRERHVPEEVIDRMAKKLQIPTIQEGFKRIEIYP